MKIAPSLLAADFLNLEKDIKRINETNCDYLHLDVMDGKFVDDITFGYPLIKELKEKCNKKLDVHLMVEFPEKLAEKLFALKVDCLTIHAEIIKNIDFDGLLQKAKDNNVILGIAFNPNTNVEEYSDYIKKVNFILIMSVYPGKGGQSFIEEVLTNVEKIKKINKDTFINIDGGVNDLTISKIKNFDIDMVVSGSYLFKGNIQEKINLLR